ncbi:MAG: hypothetical protein WC473_00400 [Patescibacteria group bacterium]
MKQTILDYLWVIVAYLRGKVLRQKAYRPQGAGELAFFQAARGANFRRISILSKWWGYRLATLDELLSAHFNQPDLIPPATPTVSYGGNYDRVSIGHFGSDGLTFDRSLERDHWGSLGFLPISR